MKDVHSKIIQSLRSGEFIKRLKRHYGDRLSHLSFWGTEPLLTTSQIIPFLPELFATFPKLKHFSFSTSLMYAPEELVRFIRALAGRDVELKVQISTDGPASITDVNRMPGAAETIVNNFRLVLGLVNDLPLGNLKINFHFKPTHGPDSIQHIVQSDEYFIPQLLYGEKKYDALNEYIEYFDRLFLMFDNVNKHKNVTLRKSKIPTLMIPGKYTSSDGELYSEYVRLFHSRNQPTAYDSRYMKIFKYGSEFFRRSTFTCSGGDSNLGIGNNLHICHRTFYFDHEEYIRGAHLQNKVDDWEVSDFSDPVIDMMNKWYIVPYDDIDRFRYVMRGYHDYIYHQWITLEALLLELALAGQVKSYYIHSAKLRDAFCLFFLTCMTCPMENLLNTGSMHLQTIGLLRLFGNGAFLQILKRRIKYS